MIRLTLELVLLAAAFTYGFVLGAGGVKDALAKLGL